MRKQLTLPLGRKVGIRLLDPLQPEAASDLVRHGLVLAGLICARGAWLLMGISALATLLLNGPTTPTTSASPTRAVMFCAPTAGSCVPLGPTSSLGTNWNVTLGTV